MINHLGRIIILVHDYDDALAFYRDTLGFELLVDTPGPGDLRFVHVGPRGQANVGIWFMQARTDAQRARVGNQTGGEPVCVLYTGDVHSAYHTLRERGVHFHGEPAPEPGAIAVHFDDLYGNEIVLVELTGH